jgi:crotonobetainyl-CoA:carnitine CoA-transferase CaiB-like acyl-CoA transferase
MTTTARPLDGVRVLELARYQAGPRGGMILSDLGAEVIKIEPPGGEETRTHPPMVRGQSVYFSVYNRGKKSVCLNLRNPRGQEVFAALVKNVGPADAGQDRRSGRGEMYLPGVTIKMSKTPGRIGPVPTPGQHTDEIISSVLGYDASAIGGLRSAGALA